jgi:hypothetical protein
MSEWAKTLLSAGVGAIAAILSTLGVELVKKTQLKKTVHDQLSDELEDNVAKIESARSIIKTEKLDQMLDAASSMAWRGLWDLKADRYQFYSSSEKALLCQFDKDRCLSKFYEAYHLVKSGHDPRGNWHLYELSRS